jgi:hypothetical protein
VKNPKDFEHEIKGYFMKGRTKSRLEQDDLQLSLWLKLM